MIEPITFARNPDTTTEIMTPDNFLHAPLNQSIAKGVAVEDAPQ